MIGDLVKPRTSVVERPPIAPGVQPRRAQQLLQLALLGTDTVGLVVAVAVAGVLRLALDSLLPVVTTLGLPEHHVVASVMIIPVLLLLFWLHGRYDIDNSLIGPREYGQIANSVTYGVILALALSYFAGGEPLVSRSWLVLVWLLSIACVSLGRFAARRVVREFRRRGVLHTRVVIVGASSLGVALAKQFQAARGEGIDVVGFLDEYLPLGEQLVDNLRVVGRPADLVIRPVNWADEYVLVPQALPHERMDEIARLMVSRAGPVLRMAVSSSDLLTHGVFVTERSNVPLVTLRRARLDGLDLALKRVMDVVGALVGLAIFGAPTLAVLAWGAWRRYHGMLSAQEIYALGGVRTRLWLLDSALTSWLMLRGVPALLTVLSGKVSLVGPRPQLCDRVATGRSSTQVLEIKGVKPGLTGPWRLLGPDATLAEQMLHDLVYVRNYSIWEDLRILWQTGPNAVTGRSSDILARWQAHAIQPELTFRSTEL